MKRFPAQTPVKNQRVYVPDHGVGTITGIDDSAFGRDLRIQFGSPTERLFPADRIDTSHDERFPLFSVRSYDELHIFHTPEPVNPAYEEEEEEFRQKGIQWFRCYSTIIPNGECGHVGRDVLLELTADEFETARRNGWRIPE